MKITVPEGPKSNLIHAICRFINFKDEGIIETGAVWPFILAHLKGVFFDDGKTTVTGLKAVIEAIVSKDKKTAVLLGGGAADKKLVCFLCFL